MYNILRRSIIIRSRGVAPEGGMRREIYNSFPPPLRNKNMRNKIFDKIKELLQKRDIYIQNPIRSPIKRGKLAVIEPYDLEVSQKEEREERAKIEGLPH